MRKKSIENVEKQQRNTKQEKQKERRTTVASFNEQKWKLVEKN